MSSLGAVGKGCCEIVAIDSIVVFHTEYHREVIVAIYVDILSVAGVCAWQFFLHTDQRSFRQDLVHSLLNAQRHLRAPYIGQDSEKACQEENRNPPAHLSC